MEEIFKYKKCRYKDGLYIFDYFCEPIDYNIRVISNNNQERQKIMKFIN